MKPALLFHDSVNCTHCNEISHFIANTKGRIVLLASPKMKCIRDQ